MKGRSPWHQRWIESAAWFAPREVQDFKDYGRWNGGPGAASYVLSRGSERSVAGGVGSQHPRQGRCGSGLSNADLYLFLPRIIPPQRAPRQTDAGGSNVAKRREFHATAEFSWKIRFRRE